MKTSAWYPSWLFSVLMLYLFPLLQSTAEAEGECKRVNDPIQCFKCDTLTESRCVDPFNYSTTYHLLEDCPGCCVKIIENMGSVDSRIRRTCTEQLEVNLFMVDHVCMTDAKGKGKMCFCETDMCNAAKTATLAASERLTALISSILSLLVVYLVGKCEQQR